MEVPEWAQGAEVEDRPDVDEEALVALSGEDLHAVGQRMDRGVRERGVVRSRPWADAHRRAREVRAEHAALALVVIVLVVMTHQDARHGIRLPKIPRRAVQRGDRPGVVQERGRVGDRRLESELVHDVGASVAVVVDLDLVQDVVAELEEVRAAGRLLEWDVVRDERHLRWVDGVDERVDVGVVGYRVFGDLGSFTM